jgi:ATP-dependent Clp protease ATP-binding subunit ClpA
MFERFTNEAKHAVVLAQDEAVTLGHDFIGTEHVLIGLARTTDGGAGEVLGTLGVTARGARNETVRLLTEAGVPATGAAPATEALAAIGINVEEIRKKAEESFGPGKFHFPRPPFTPKAKKALETTLREAKALGHTHIDTEHLLMGIIEDEDSIAVKVLTELGVDQTELRTALIAKVTPQSS